MSHENLPRGNDNQEKDLFRWNEGLDLRRKKSEDSRKQKSKSRAIDKGIDDYFNTSSEEDDDIFDDEPFPH